MNRRLSIVLSVIFLALPASTNAAQITLTDLKDICVGTGEASTAACKFYIWGVMEGVGLEAGLANDKAHFCVPEGVSSQRVISTVKEKITADLLAFPKDNDMPAVAFVSAVLQGAFPCSK